MKKPAVAKHPTQAKHAKATTKKKTKARSRSTASKKHTPDAHQLHLKHEATEHSKHEAHVAHEEKIGKAPLLVGDVACCSAEAVAASARLAGIDVHADDVLDLYWRTADGPDAGASLLATLAAAAECGLAGYRPRWFGPMGGMAGQDSNLQPPISGGYASDPSRLPHGALSIAPPAIPGTSVLTHVELPAAPHSLCIDPAGRGVWSWGDLYDPAELDAGPALESWAVVWS